MFVMLSVLWRCTQCLGVSVEGKSRVVGDAVRIKTTLQSSVCILFLRRSLSLSFFISKSIGRWYNNIENTHIYVHALKCHCVERFITYCIVSVSASSLRLFVSHYCVHGAKHHIYFNIWILNGINKEHNKRLMVRAHRFCEHNREKAFIANCLQIDRSNFSSKLVLKVSLTTAHNSKFAIFHLYNEIREYIPP